MNTLRLPRAPVGDRPSASPAPRMPLPAAPLSPSSGSLAPGDGLGQAPGDTPENAPGDALGDIPGNPHNHTAGDVPEDRSTVPSAMDFGDRVRQQRRSQKLSQQELADRVGISRNYLSQIERGVATNLSWQVHDRLCAALNLQAPQPQALELPPSLVAFAEMSHLPSDDLLMLARLKYRGQQPTTPEKWAQLYNAIQMTLEP